MEYGWCIKCHSMRMSGMTGIFSRRHTGKCEKCSTVLTSKLAARRNSESSWPIPETFGGYRTGEINIISSGNSGHSSFHGDGGSFGGGGASSSWDSGSSYDSGGSSDSGGGGGGD